jgi:hypothetical protein
MTLPFDGAVFQSTVCSSHDAPAGRTSYPADDALLENTCSVALTTDPGRLPTLKRTRLHVTGEPSARTYNPEP